MGSPGDRSEWEQNWGLDSGARGCWLLIPPLHPRTKDGEDLEDRARPESSESPASHTWVFAIPVPSQGPPT